MYQKTIRIITLTALCIMSNLLIAEDSKTENPEVLFALNKQNSTQIANHARQQSPNDKFGFLNEENKERQLEAIRESLDRPIKIIASDLDKEILNNALLAHKNPPLLLTNKRFKKPVFSRRDLSPLSTLSPATTMILASNNIEAEALGIEIHITITDAWTNSKQKVLPKILRAGILEDELSIPSRSIVAIRKKSIENIIIVANSKMCNYASRLCQRISPASRLILIPSDFSANANDVWNIRSRDRIIHPPRMTTMKSSLRFQEKYESIKESMNFNNYILYQTVQRLMKYKSQDQLKKAIDSKILKVGPFTIVRTGHLIGIQNSFHSISKLSGDGTVVKASPILADH